MSGIANDQPIPQVQIYDNLRQKEKPAKDAPHTNKCRLNRIYGLFKRRKDAAIRAESLFCWISLRLQLLVDRDQLWVSVFAPV
jgi:hypothetical protein